MILIVPHDHKFEFKFLRRTLKLTVNSTDALTEKSFHEFLSTLELLLGVYVTQTDVILKAKFICKHSGTKTARVALNPGHFVRVQGLARPASVVARTILHDVLRHIEPDDPRECFGFVHVAPERVFSN